MNSSCRELISIGVDVGSRNGAIAIINEDLKILYLAKAPCLRTEIKSKVLKPKLNKETGKFEKSYKTYTWTDYKELGKIYEPYLSNDIIYTVERVSVRPGEGETNSFKFGNSLGVHEGLYSFLNPIEYYEPTPQVWKKDFGLHSDKEVSIELAKDIFNCDLRTYLKRGKLDDIAEALLLSFYGLKKHYEKLGEL